MQESGREIDPADMPPALAWEEPVWMLYLRLATQWRFNHQGRPIGLDYNPAIALIRHWGWQLDLALELLQAIEAKMMEPRAA